MPDRILCFDVIEFFMMCLSDKCFIDRQHPEEDGGRVSTSSNVSNCSVVPVGDLYPVGHAWYEAPGGVT